MLLNQRQLNSATKHWLTEHKPDPMSDDIRKSKPCGEVSENGILGCREIKKGKEKKKRKEKKRKEKFPTSFDQ